MNLFTLALADNVSAAPANPGGLSGFLGSGLGSLVPMIAIFAIFYFMLIRPQMKKQKELQHMISELKKGDKVVAAGGIVGKIIKIEDEIVSLDTGSGNKIDVMKASVTTKIDKKSVKS